MEQLASPFKPETFKNEHNERVHNLIAQKAKGKEIIAAEEPKHETVGSLAEALERSLAGGKPAGRAHKPARRAEPSRAAPKRRAAAR